jgi:hypothetical protein
MARSWHGQMMGGVGCSMANSWETKAWQAAMDRITVMTRLSLHAPARKPYSEHFTIVEETASGRIEVLAVQLWTNTRHH